LNEANRGGRKRNKGRCTKQTKNLMSIKEPGGKKKYGRRTQKRGTPKKTRREKGKKKKTKNAKNVTGTGGRTSNGTSHRGEKEREKSGETKQSTTGQSKLKCKGGRGVSPKEACLARQGTQTRQKKNLGGWTERH